MAYTKTKPTVPEYVEKATAAAILNEAITTAGTLRQVADLAHILSIPNQGRVFMQDKMAGRPHGLTGTRKNWEKRGYKVKPSENGHAMWVLAPVSRPVPETDDDGNPVIDQKTKKPKVRWVPIPGRFKYIASRYSFTQVEGQAVAFPETPFDLGALLCALEVELVDFEMDDMQCGGYCYGTDDGDFLAINPLWPDPLGVLFHELGHIVLGHTRETAEPWVTGDRTPRNRRELSAEGVTLVLLDTLGYEEQQYSRGYMQNWNIEGLSEIPEELANDVFNAGNIIYRAGLGLPIYTTRMHKKKED
jgi:hypothetical protein